MNFLQDLLLVPLGALQLLLLQLHGFQLPEPLLLDLGGAAVGWTPMSVVSVLQKGRLISTDKSLKSQICQFLDISHAFMVSNKDYSHKN